MNHIKEKKLQYKIAYHAIKYDVKIIFPFQSKKVINFLKSCSRIIIKKILRK